MNCFVRGIYSRPFEYMSMRETCVQMYFVYTMVYITEVHSFSLVFFLSFFLFGEGRGTGLYSNSNSSLLSNTPYIIPCIVLVVNIFLINRLLYMSLTWLSLCNV